MRLLFVTGSYPPMKCGVGAYTQKLAQALASRSDCQVMVLTDRRANFENLGSAVEVHPTIMGWALLDLVSMIRQIRNLHPDVVHFQYPTQGYSGRGIFLLPVLLRWVGFPCVHTWHEPALGRSGVLLALGLDYLIVVKKDLKRHLSFATNRILHNKRAAFVSGASMLPAVQLSESERTSIREKYVLGDERLLVFYGFLAPLKGVETLLELVAQTKSKLVLACDFEPAHAYHQALLAQIEALQIGPQVQITGFLPDRELAMLLGSADAAVFPFKEGAADWNTSIDGAIAQGVFVLTTTTSESSYNRERHTYRAQVGAINEMKEALEQYAGTRVNVKSADADWSIVADAHRKIYRELMS